LGPSVLQSIHERILDAATIEVRRTVSSAASSAGCAATAAPPAHTGSRPSRSPRVGTPPCLASARADNACSGHGRVCLVPRRAHALDRAAREGAHHPSCFRGRLGWPCLQFEAGADDVAPLPRRYLREMGVALSRSRSGARDEVATRTTSRNRTNGRRRRPQLRSSCLRGSAQGCRDALAQTRRRGGAGGGCGRARAPIRATALSLAGGSAFRGASRGGRGSPAEPPCAPSDLRPPAIAAAERLTGLHPPTAGGPIDAAENDEKHEDDDPSCRVQCPHPFLTGRDTNLRSITPSNRHFH
jgi:hypothetical protein